MFGQLAATARAGFPLGEAVAIMRADAGGARFGRLLEVLEAELKRGAGMADAMKACEGAFLPETVAFVRAGEESGRLPVALQALSVDCNRRGLIRSAIWNALAWPMAIASVAALAVMVLMIFVIPSFKQVFASFGADLPGLTLLVMNLSDVLVAYWWLAAIVVVALVAGWPLLRRRAPAVANAAEGVVVTLPVFGSFLRGTFQARFASMLSAVSEEPRLFAAAIGHLRTNTGNRRLSGWLAPVEGALAAGESMADAVRMAPEVPRRVAMMIDLGMRSGDIRGALAQIEAWSDTEFMRTLPRFEQRVLLMAYLVLGIVVALIVIAMYLPIFKLGSAV
jgi:type IV pilus assembly protein PilC